MRLITFKCRQEHTEVQIEELIFSDEPAMKQYAIQFPSELSEFQMFNSEISTVQIIISKREPWGDLFWDLDKAKIHNIRGLKKLGIEIHTVS